MEFVRVVFCLHVSLLFTWMVFYDVILLIVVLVVIGKILFAGCVCYADDIVLLAPRPSALRTMLNICCKYRHLTMG